MAFMKCAIIGCGIISKSYLDSLTKVFDNLQVATICDIVDTAAKIRSEEYGIPAQKMEDILADPEIEMVIVLTPAPSHYEIIKKALLAGKHVFTEKVMTLEATQAKELLEISDAMGVRLGAAPDTFMGSSVQKAKELLEKDSIGEITSFRICVNANLDVNASFYPILRMPGGGFLCDIGVYYLTVLVNLLGRIDQVAAMVENCKPVRIDINPKSKNFGKPFGSPNESRVTAILHTASGITGALCLNGESAGGGFCFDLIGRKGILHLADANRYSNDIYMETPENGNVLIENELPSFVGRGLGPSEMAEAIREGRPHQASKEQAYHVLEIIDALFKSNETHAFVNIHSQI